MNTKGYILVLVLISNTLLGGEIAIDRSRLSSASTWFFEENKGQVTGTDASLVNFLYKKNNIKIFLLKTGLAYQFQKTSFPKEYRAMDKSMLYSERKKLEELEKDIVQETYRMDIELIGANPNAEITTEGRSTDYIQYYNQNALDVHAYSRVIYHNIYPNIDWVIYTEPQKSIGENQNHGIKYDFIVHPGGNPNSIQMKTKWVEKLALSDEGNLSMSNRIGTVDENSPRCFQDEQLIQSRFLLKGDIISFHIDPYDPSKVLVIDPIILWATYYGDTFQESDISGAKDLLGNVYLSGATTSGSNIASGGHQTSYGTNRDAFLVKFNSSGTRLWATYYGGSNPDRGTACATDASNNVFLTGYTVSSNNISSGGFQSALGATNYNAFLVKFNSAGTRQWGTYYGGTDVDQAFSCAVDTGGNIYITGIANSTSGIASSGHQNSNNGSIDAFLAKFSTSGTRLWATYYGGSSTEQATSCATDGLGNVFLAGSTVSNSNIASSGHQNSIATSGVWDGFLVKFNGSGTRQWATYYGGTSDDYGFGCAADKNGNSFLSGYTYSGTGIASGGHQNSGAGSNDAFLVKFNGSGARQWGTYYGGSNGDYAPFCSTDTFGNVYIAGFTLSTNNVAFGGYQTTLAGFEDAFIAKFDGLGIRQWSSYFGGSSDDRGAVCFADNFGHAYLGGITLSANNIGYSGHQNTYKGNWDGFLVKIPENVDPSIFIYSDQGDTICAGDTITFISIVANGGSNPKYKWYKNGLLIDSTANYKTANIANGDSFYCRIKSSATGINVDTAWSNKKYMRLKYPSVDTVRVNICENQSYLFKSINRNVSGTYYDTLVNKVGCDSFRTLILMVKDTSHGSFSYSICANQAYTFNGIDRSTAGAYKDTLVNAVGCDSILTLNLTVKSISMSSFSQTICANQSFVFNGIARNTAGAFKDTFTNLAGCDSIVTMNLSVKPVSTGSFSQTICGNQFYTYNGIPRNMTGAYLDTLTNSVGCDSVVTLNLTVNPVTTTTLNISICTGGSYFFNSLNRTTSGTYLDTLTDSKGCDSFITLNLSIYPPTSYTYSYTTCSNMPYFFNGQFRTTSGTYLDTILNSLGCDSFLTVNLVVNSISSYNFNDTTCSNTPYFFNSQNRTISGVYRDTLINSKGCDSFIFLNLTVKATTNYNFSIRKCQGDSFEFPQGKNVWKKTTGIYRDTIKNGNRVGCDSFIRLDLAFGLPNADTLKLTTCVNNPYFFKGQFRSTTGFYRDTLYNIYGCDSIKNLDLIVNPTSSQSLTQTICQGQSVSVGTKNYINSGIYKDTLKNSFSCDSFVTLDLTVDSVYTTILDTVICYNSSVFFNGNLITNAGVFRDTLVSVKSCDSFIVLNVFKKDTSSFRIFHTLCSNRLLPFNGYIPNATGVYKDTLRNRSGCDSFLYFNLKVIPTSSRVRYDTLCFDESIVFKGKIISAAGVYYDTLLSRAGCDSFLQLNLTKRASKTVVISNTNGTLLATYGYNFYQWFRNNIAVNNENYYFHNPMQSGQFFVQATDSFHCHYKSNELNYTMSSIMNSLYHTAIEIYPIPTKDILFLKSNNFDDKYLNIAIYNMEGKRMDAKVSKYTAERISLSVSHLSKGLYFIEIGMNSEIIKRKFTIE